jgi:hypothetical protein
MSYEEWLNKIEALSNKNDYNILKELETAPYNANLEELLTPKLSDLVTKKLTKSINSIVKSLELIYKDPNELDICMIEFKKNIQFIYKLINIKQLKPEKQQEMRANLKTETDKTYDILEKEAVKIDNLGIFQMVIRNNRIKWSDNNELQ